MVTTAREPDTVRAILEQVVDPEIPVLTIGDMGILRDVTVADDGMVRVVVTPTYSGCPAMDLIRDEIVDALAAAGIDRVTVDMVFSPPWTTEWMSDHAKEKLRAFGIAPPGSTAGADPVLCPRCASASTRTVSEFGSTACKALMVCEHCGEPFDRFKEI